MTTFILTREAMRLVDKDEKGRVTSRKRLRKGQEVDSDLLPEWRVDALVKSGALVEKGEFEKRQSEALNGPDDFPAYLGGERPSNWADFSADEKREYVLGLAGSPEEGEETEGEETEGEEDEKSAFDLAVEKYSDKDAFSYADLQKIAQEKVGDGSGGREALVQRIASFEAAASDDQ